MTETKSPRVSVCVPVFNGANFIRESVECVLNQTEEDFELLVVDNCSTDHTAEIVAGYDDPRIRLSVNPQNVGLIANFNKCIELAKGDFIVLLPHDDVLLPTALETFSQALMADSDIGLVYSSFYSIDEKGNRLRLLSRDRDDRVMTGLEAFAMLAEGCPIQCAMTRRDVYARVGLWDPAIMTCDWDVWCRVALAGYKYAYLSAPQNCYRVHPENGYIAYVRDNAYNIGVFRGMEKVYGAIPADSDLQRLRAISASKWILKPQLKHLVSSVITARWMAVRQDLALLVRIVKWAGAFRLVPFLLGMPWELMKWLGRRLEGTS